MLLPPGYGQPTWPWHFVISHWQYAAQGPEHPFTPHWLAMMPADHATSSAQQCARMHPHVLVPIGIGDARAHASAASIVLLASLASPELESRAAESVASMPDASRLV